MRPSTEPGLALARVPLDHPDALALIEAVQLEYVERYGSRDDSPIDVAEFAGDRGAFFLGRLEGEPVASGAWRFRPVPTTVAEWGAVAVEVKRMYVVPFARRRGLSRVVLTHLETTAAAAGAQVVVLETGVMQPEAIALYRSSGYDEVPGFGHYQDSPLSRCFAKRL